MLALAFPLTFGTVKLYDPRLVNELLKPFVPKEAFVQEYVAAPDTDKVMSAPSRTVSNRAFVTSSFSTTGGRKAVICSEELAETLGEGGGAEVSSLEP
jgi:hypothetical protein